MTRYDIYDKLSDCFVRTFGVDPLTLIADLTPDSCPAWDSLGHIRLVAAIESEFGVSLSVEDAMQMMSAREIVDLLERRLP